MSLTISTVVVVDRAGVRWTDGRPNDTMHGEVLDILDGVHAMPQLSKGTDA